MIEGFLTVSKVVDAFGKPVSTQKAVDYGWIKPAGKSPAGWGIDRHEIPLGYNTALDNFRQFKAYLFGGRTPTTSFVCSNFGIGTSNTPTNASDTDLVSPLSFYDAGGASLEPIKPIDGVDYPAPFVARVEITLAPTEANGILIKEWGLYAKDTGSGIATILCRKVEPSGFEKIDGHGPTFMWRVRM